MKNKEEFELKVLKQLVTSQKAVYRAIALNIKPKHFEYKEEMTSTCYHEHFCKILFKYFEESNGLLLTPSVLESKLIKANVTDAHKMKFILLWEKVQEQDFNENDLFDLLISLKQNLALTYLNDLFKEGHDAMAEEGLDSATKIIKEKIEQIETEMSLMETDRQSIDITENGAEYFEKEYAKRRDHFDQYKGIFCGLDNIDSKTFGFGNSQIVVLLAPSSGGKSVQLLNWGAHAHMEEKKNVLYFSFEMDAWLCTLRHLSLAFRVPYAALKSITCPPDELLTLIEKTKQLEGGPYFEYDVNMEDPTPEYIDGRIRDLMNTKGKPDLVIVDYIGNMTTRESRRDAKPWEKQGDAFEKLFALAKRYQIPFITAQQVNRENIKENRKAKESGKVAQYWQDAASGDQRIMHFAHYVIAMEPDKDNNMVTYHPVKMRDAMFEPFSARVDPIYNGIYELTSDEQVDYDKIRNSGVIVKSSETDAPKILTGENGSTIVQTGKATNIYSPADLEVNALDDWAIVDTEEGND